MVICLQRGANLHMAQLMTMPLTVSCFSKIQIGFTFLVPAHPDSPGQRAVKRVCVCVCTFKDPGYPATHRTVTILISLGVLQLQGHLPTATKSAIFRTEVLINLQIVDTT